MFRRLKEKSNEYEVNKIAPCWAPLYTVSHVGRHYHLNNFSSNIHFIFTDINSSVIVHTQYLSLQKTCFYVNIAVVEMKVTCHASNLLRAFNFAI